MIQLKLILLIFNIVIFLNLSFGQELKLETIKDSRIHIIIESLREIQSYVKNNQFEKIAEKFCDAKVEWVVKDCPDTTLENKYLSKNSNELIKKIKQIFTQTRLADFRILEDEIKFGFWWGSSKTFNEQEIKLYQHNINIKDYYIFQPLDNFDYSTGGGNGMKIKIKNNKMIIYHLLEIYSC